MLLPMGSRRSGIFGPASARGVVEHCFAGPVDEWSTTEVVPKSLPPARQIACQRRPDPAAKAIGSENQAYRRLATKRRPRNNRSRLDTGSPPSESAEGATALNPPRAPSPALPPPAGRPADRNSTAPRPLNPPAAHIPPERADRPAPRIHTPTPGRPGRAASHTPAPETSPTARPVRPRRDAAGRCNAKRIPRAALALPRPARAPARQMSPPARHARPWPPLPAQPSDPETVDAAAPRGLFEWSLA